eukprot:4167294-Heterocapsa_arctica.AAC.1
MFGSLGKQGIDGYVVVTCLAVDKSAVGQESLGCHLRLHGTDPSRSVGSLPAPVPQAELCPLLATHCLRTWDLDAAQSL